MLYYLRHGQTTANAEHRLAGQEDDSALTKLGMQQAAEAAKKAKTDGMQITRIICSPLRRSRTTAEIFAAAYGFTGTIEEDVRITERAMGVVSGLNYDEAPKGDWSHLEGVEQVEAVRDRVISFWREHQQDDGLLVVGHDGAQKVMETLRQGVSLQDLPALPSFPQDCVVVVDLSWLQ